MLGAIDEMVGESADRPAVRVVACAVVGISTGHVDGAVGIVARGRFGYGVDGLVIAGGIHGHDGGEGQE